MNKPSQKRLLEELVRKTIEEALLAEQTDFSNDVLYKAFVEPFTDIIATAAHGVEKISATAQGEAKLLVKQLAFLFIPFIKPEAGSLRAMAAQDRQKMAARLGEIDGQFKDVLDRNWQAFNNPDVWGTLFLLHPQAAIAQKMVSKAPEVALELLGVLTGGSEAVASILKSYRDMKTGGGRVTTRQHSSEYGYDSGGYADMGDLGGDYGGIWEQRAPVQTPTPKQAPQAPQTKQNPEAWLRSQLAGLLRRPDIKKQIAGSKVARAMQGEAVNYIVRAAVKDLSFNFPQMKAKLGANYQKAISSLGKGETDDKILADIEKDQELQKKIVATVKDMLKPAYVRQLETLLTVNPAAKPMVTQAIQKINAIQ